MTSCLRTLALLLVILPLAPAALASSYCEGEDVSLKDLLGRGMEVTILLGEPTGPELPPFDEGAPRPIARIVEGEGTFLSVTDPGSGAVMLFPLEEVGDCIVKIDYPLAREILSQYRVEEPAPEYQSAYMACVEDPSATVPRGFDGVYFDLIPDGNGVFLRIAAEVPATYRGAEAAHQVLHVCSPRTSSPTMGMVFAFEPAGGS